MGTSCSIKAELVKGITKPDERCWRHLPDNVTEWHGNLMKGSGSNVQDSTVSATQTSTKGPTEACDVAGKTLFALPSTGMSCVTQES